MFRSKHPFTGSPEVSPPPSPSRPRSLLERLFPASSSPRPGALQPDKVTPNPSGSPGRGSTLADHLDDKYLYTAFSILQLAHMQTIPEFTGLLSIPFESDSEETIDLAFLRALDSSFTGDNLNDLLPSYSLVDKVELGGLHIAPSDLIDNDGYLDDAPPRGPQPTATILMGALQGPWAIILEKAVTALPEPGTQSPFNKVKEFFRITLDATSESGLAGMDVKHTEYARFALVLAAQMFEKLPGNEKDGAVAENIYDIIELLEQKAGWKDGYDPSSNEAMESINNQTVEEYILEQRFEYIQCLGEYGLIKAQNLLLEY
ncbi:hypothetical protein BJ085DRAFT_34226 [Dimargaris cristalligena]|uniref:Uncharacterized protein n=1 Tax=Dimargaris cristalligena TaxID=215637 RepID=A0A4Q0A3U9_9FUNG|nr:hypothetical protein BJ085DRAFT_34226 [Dimargaris cristalligena]|eukprot:RKP40082.1 hypothetical protein BJ085DRAFT_34226 [Dimargaris cristalligena]